MTTNIGYDSETYLIGAPDQLIPKLVCGSWDVDGNHTAVFSNADGGMLTWSQRMWERASNNQARIIAHNAAFDICVQMRWAHENGHMDLYKLMWAVLDQSMDNEWENIQRGSGLPILVSDTLIREKLYFLSKYGGIQIAPWGKPIKYGLADLVMHYFKINIYNKKVSMRGDRVIDNDGNDITGTPAAASIWRLRYKELDGIPSDQWPRDAYGYALDDATWARKVWEVQERNRKDFRHGSMNSESLQVYASICLQITTAVGFRVDTEQVQRLEDRISSELKRIEPILRENGVVRSNGSVNTSVVKDRVGKIWAAMDHHPIMTDTGDIATGKEVQEILAQLDPVLDLWAERQQLVKVRDAFLPNLKGSHVWTNFDILKETGRTSSNKGKMTSYAAVNSQQIPRAPGVRETFLPPRGYIIGSVDYGAQELCSVGQITYTLFGRSKHRDRINDGYDLHSYLGAAIASYKEPSLVDGIRFMDSDDHAKHAYEAFMRSRKTDDKDIKKQAKHFRNLAKPVGLGYPGGLSVKTLCTFAKTVYKVEISEKESEEFRALWFDIYPEMKDYFRWVRDQEDRGQAAKQDDEGRILKSYCYETPGFRRFRAGATYCATANGASMQSLSADGSKRSVCWLGRACAGAAPEGSPYQILDKCMPLTFIHDENLIAIPCDALMTERAIAVQNLMVDALQVHMPDVRLTAEPALMTRWIKAAEPEWHPAYGDWGRDAAANMLEDQYGVEMANKMLCAFRAPQGSQMRLAPWDWFNTVEGMEGPVA